MGSQSSKSSESCESSRITKLDVLDKAWSAGDPELVKQFDDFGYQFVEVAVWARPLPGKDGIETGNITSKQI